MKKVESAKDYVLKKCIYPVLESTDPRIKRSELLYRNQSAKRVLKILRRTGDVYDYLKHSMKDSKNIEFEAKVREYGFKPFGDIIKDFEKIYKNELNDKIKIDDYIVGNKYTKLEIIFLNGTTDTRSRAILTFKDNQPGVLILGSIINGSSELSRQAFKYANEWIDKGKILKYYLDEYKDKSSVSRKIINGEHTHFFEKVAENEYIYRGAFVFNDFYNKDEGSIILKKIKPDGLSKINYEKKFPSGVLFEQLEERTPTRFGTDQIGENKRKKGRSAEEYVMKFLELMNIDFKDDANNSKCPWDITLTDKNKEIGLEVKNVGKQGKYKYFYLSNNEIIYLKNGKSRLCITDEKGIWISKKYNELQILNNIIEKIPSVKNKILKDYGGTYRIFEVEIALLKEYKSDFIEIDNLNYEGIINCLYKS